MHTDFIANKTIYSNIGLKKVKETKSNYLNESETEN